MNNESYLRLERHFHHVSDLPGEERATYIKRVEAEEPELAGQLEALLDAMEEPAGGEADSLGLGPGLFQALLPEDGSRDDDASLPTSIGPYRVLRRVGAGGMGVVFEAEQRSPRRRVAIKVVQSFAGDSGAERRFARESEILGQLDHPGIARIFEAGQFDLGAGPRPYFSMEFIEGVDLRTYADRQGLDRQMRVGIVAQVAEAVAHAHERGVVHRDLKPENTLVREDGSPIVVDFGLGRFLEGGAESMSLAQGALIGTLAYMAPESASLGGGTAGGPRGDVYSLGVILFELLAERRPYDFAGLSVTAALERLTGPDVPRLSMALPGVHRDLEIIVGRAMDKDPARRFANAGELAADLRRFLAHEPIVSRAPSWLYLTSRFVRRRRAVAGFIVALVAAAGVSIWFALLASARSRDAIESRATMRSTLYRAQMVLGGQAARNPRGSDALRRYLEPWRPGSREDEDEDLRGWEWRHLDARLRLDGQVLRHGSRFESIALRGDGSMRIEADRERAALYLEDSIEPIAEVEHPSSSGFAPAWVAGRPWVAFTNGDLVIVDMESGQEMARIPLEGPMVDCALSPAGTHAAVSNRAESLWLYDLETREVLWSREAIASREPGGLSFSHDGSQIATGGPRGELRVLDVTDGAEALLVPHDDSEYLVSRAVWQRGQPVLVFSRGGRDFWIVNVADQAVTRVTEAHGLRVADLAFSPGGDELATVSWDGGVALWDLESARLVRRAGADTLLSAIRFDGMGALVAAAPSGERFSWSLEECWPVERGWPVARANGGALPRNDLHRLHDGEGASLGRASTIGVSTHALSAFERYVVTPEPTADGTRTRVVEVASGRLVFEAEHPGYRQVGYAWHNQREAELTILRGAPRTQVIDVTTGAEAREFEAEPCHLVLWDGARSAAFTSNSTPHVTRIDERGEALEQSDEFGAIVMCLAASPDGHTLAVGTRGGEVELLDADSLDRLATVLATANEIQAIQWSPDGTRIAAGAVNGDVALIDPAAGALVTALRAERPVYGIGWSDDGDRLWARLDDDSLQSWGTRR